MDGTDPETLAQDLSRIADETEATTTDFGKTRKLVEGMRDLVQKHGPDKVTDWAISEVKKPETSDILTIEGSGIYITRGINEAYTLPKLLASARVGEGNFQRYIDALKEKYGKEGTDFNDQIQDLEANMLSRASQGLQKQTT